MMYSHHAPTAARSLILWMSANEPFKPPNTPHAEGFVPDLHDCHRLAAVLVCAYICERFRCVKADFRGNLATLVSKGGEKIIKDLLKAEMARREEEQKKSSQTQIAGQAYP
jgi:hypothetical protein